MKTDELRDHLSANIDHHIWYVLRRCGRSVDPEDVRQDLFVAVLQRLERFNPSRASARTYVCNLLRWQAMELVRRHYRCRNETPPIISLSTSQARDGLRSCQIATSDDTRRHRPDALSGTERSDLLLDLPVIVSRLRGSRQRAGQALLARLRAEHNANDL